MSTPTVEKPQDDTETVPANPDTSETKTSGLSQTMKEAARLGKRWRKQALPLAAIGGTHGVGAVSASLAGPAAFLPIAAGCAAAGGAYGYAHKTASRWDRVYAGVAAVGSAAGQAAVALDGATGVTAGLLWACGCALSVPYWVRHAEPDPDITAELAAPAPKPAAELPVAPSTVDKRVTLWNEHLAANNKPLPGSDLAEIAGFAYGWKATVTLAIGEHWHTLLGARKALLSVFDLPDGRVFVEPVRGQSVRKARLTVLTTDPLESTTRWTGPQLDPSTGSFPLMVAADGEPLHFKVWQPGAGARHALISGVTRSGKTKVLDLILTELGMSDRAVALVIDGGGGASLPQWRGRTKLFAGTPADARKTLRYVLRLMERRRPVVERQRGGSLEPSSNMPLIPVVMDEAHKLLMSDDETDNRDIVRMCEKIVQEGAKFGICLILATQVPSVRQLGNSTALRDQVKAGTIVGLRITEKGTGNMIDTGDPMPEHLRDLPAEFPDGSPTHGLGYMMTSRKIRARALLLENPDEYRVLDTGLDADCAREPVPSMDGIPAEGDDPGSEPTDSEGSSTAVVFDQAEAQDRIAKALGNGVAPDDVAGLMQATGLSMSQIRKAVRDQ